jgi:hypothetical protein
MPKKPRSARRRKNAISMNGKLDDVDVDAEVLSENHTIADTIISGDFDIFDDELEEDYLAVANDVDTITDITSTTNSNTIRQTKLLDTLSLASTMTTEKRSTKREQSLKSLFKSITQYATSTQGQETILSKLNDTILPLCIVGLRSGVASPSEQYASCRVLEATSVVIGGNQDDYCESIYDLLVKIVKATGRASQVRGAALRALSMSYFICCANDHSGTDAILNLCENVCGVRYRGEEVPSHLRAVALDCWALLSTTLHKAYISGDEIVGGIGDLGRGVTILPLLSDCLNHVNLDLRCAAGECVALIHEARLELGIDDDEGENATERRFRRGSWDGSEWEVLMDEVRQRVSELSVESGHHMSKKAKKEQRATFREFMATIVEDESPSEVVTFRGGTLTLTSWQEIVQLNFIRHCLQSGFQIQLMTNYTLQIIFGADGNTLNSNATMSQLEKRLTLSKTSEASKAADREMLKRRKSKRNKQNHFLTIDGEDI